jgi:hypothetical protein
MNIKFVSQLPNSQFSGSKLEAQNFHTGQTPWFRHLLEQMTTKTSLNS